MTATSNRTTGIEWTEHTWNPFVGCTLASPGCTNCYAMKQAAYIEAVGKSPTYQGLTRRVNGKAVWTGRINHATANVMRKPLSIRQPSRIFVNSMSDFFHPSAPDEWRVEVLAVIDQAPRHQYQILTKHPEEIAPFQQRTKLAFPPQVWLGVTVERGDYGWRLDKLRAIDACVRFISFEPLIGPLGDLDLTGMHWAIIGGESGPGARPMHLDWARQGLELCHKFGVAAFFKQWGIAEANPLWHTAPAGTDPELWVVGQDPNGKGGSLLDGRHWKEYPSIHTQEQLL